MRDNAHNFIRAHHLLSQGGRVIAALSGGADSVALFSFLLECRGEYALTLRACHVNHHLRGEESDRDARFVRALCEEKGIPLDLLDADVKAHAAQKKCSLEVAARDIRYDYFETLGALHGAKIATAHTLSDNVETVLFRLARGTAPHGLCGIPPVRGRMIRPLLGCTREEIEAYCAAEGLAYVTDSSNLADDFTRNRIRHHLIPQLREINPSAERAVARLIERMGETEDYMRWQTRQAILSRDASGTFPRSVFLELHPAVASRVVMELIRPCAENADTARLALCLEAARAGSGAVQLSGEYRFCADARGFGVRLVSQPPVSQLELPFAFGVFSWENRTLEVVKIEECTWNSTEISKKINHTLLKNVVDYDRIDGKAVFRLKQDGDRIRLPGRPEKSLKKLFQETGVEPSERSGRWVLCDGEGVAWAEGFGAAARVSAGPQTKNPVWIHLE